MPKVLVVGASRGLGLAIVEELQNHPSTTVIATVRGSIPLEGIDTLTDVDISSDDSIAKAAQHPLVQVLDMIIVNAAMGTPGRLLSTSTDTLSEYLSTNVVGPHRVVSAFIPALRRGRDKKIVFISSRAGSMHTQIGNSFGLMGPYTVTKAGCNMLAVQYHNELEKEGFIVVPVNPGWVATDMGNLVGNGGMEPKDSAKGIVRVVEGLKREDSAKFFQFDGTLVPW
ncbi:uncharacterized protein EV420DRAFT_1647734 [Desarmillaria tabescens]|uniref:NAD(P)-binding protein n=1 Tax=Armillaria tabescens TaxID=1929756 RepID=A0AA39MV75_ARMTA|nr:uncharacterized protein EV420DRAFT_1647734 [Desarmillaria tabescens]KAK0447408.1 hypothetical protein EV420DRAFT_1647734 [Desarmillaria tabescens]